ncbi:MAG: hypothetical protein JNL08_18280 [Planctomycetes bacterium]|nr:hypothetical protein [Planctomycetota bacterium]
MRPRHLVILASVALVLLAITVVAVVRSRAEAAWQAMQAAIAAVETELRAQPTGRAPLWAERGPGSAFEWYGRAAAHLPRSDAWLTQVDEAAAASAPPSNDLRDTWQAALSALRAGATATDVARPLPGRGRADAPEQVPDWLTLARCAALETRALSAGGDGPGAARCWLDAATFAGDLTHQGTLLDHALAATVLVHLCTELPETELARLPPEALGLLADGCARLDATLPARPDPRVDLLAMAALLQTTATAPGVVAWRHGFSVRWMVGAAVADMAEHTRRLETGADAPWSRRAAQLRAAQAAVRADDNQLLRMTLPNLLDIEREWRRMRASLRVLRVSLALHQGREPPDLADPVGGDRIRVDARADGVRIACAPLDEAEVPTRLFVR